MTAKRTNLVAAERPHDDDKLSVVISGPPTADRSRLIRVLTRLLDSDEEWETARPNTDLFVDEAAQ